MCVCTEDGGGMGEAQGHGALRKSAAGGLLLQARLHLGRGGLYMGSEGKGKA